MQKTLETQKMQETKRRAKAIREENKKILRLAIIKKVTTETKRPAKWAIIKWVME